MKFNIKNLKRFTWDKIKSEEMFNDKSNKNLNITMFIGFLGIIFSTLFEVIMIFILYLIYKYLGINIFFILYCLLFVYFSIVTYIYFEGGLMIVKYSLILKNKD